MAPGITEAAGAQKLLVVLAPTEAEEVPPIRLVQEPAPRLEAVKMPGTTPIRTTPGVPVKEEQEELAMVPAAIPDFS